MRKAFLVLSAIVCQAQDPALPVLLAKAQRLSTDQVQSLQARLMADPAPADRKAYHDLYLSYIRVSRIIGTDPKGAAPLLDRTVKALEGTRDPEKMALLAGCLGLKISLSPMSGMTLGPRSMGLLDQARAQAPGNPRVMVMRGVQVLHSPAFVGGGPEKAIPILQAAVAAAAQEPAPADPWAPAWGRVESLSWLALAQAQAGQIQAAKATVLQARALDRDNGFLDTMVVPHLQEKGR